MLFMVEIKPMIPPHLDEARVKELLVLEREAALAFQKEGSLLHLWRTSGRRNAVTIWDVASNEELHAKVSALPLFTYLETIVTPLSRHPSAA
jgi:muconolactone D-isomerase